MRASPGSDAFSKVVREHQTALYRYCRGLTANEQAAEDLLQETFLSAFRGFDGFREESALRTWLFTIARRAAQRLGRRRAGEPAAFEEFQELGAQAGWGKIESPEVREFAATVADLRRQLGLAEPLDPAISERLARALEQHD